LPTLTSNAQFLRYAEDEYLSEFHLRALKPKPRSASSSARLPESVTFEWGQVAGNGKLQAYIATATGVTRWSLDGEWDKHAVVEFGLTTTKSGISFWQKVPGLLQLDCAALTIERGGIKRYTPPPEIRPDNFLVGGPQEVTWNQLREWLGVPSDYVLHDQTGDKLTPLDPASFDTPITGPYYMPTRVQAVATPKSEKPWLWVMWMLGIGTVGHYLSINRGTCDDASWARAVRLPQHLGPTDVMSGTVKCSSATWLEKWVPTIGSPADAKD